jgi:uncharacterized protein (DUF608 family)
MIIFFLSHGILAAQSPPWPVLKHYDAAHVDRIAMPIGGIGTGTVSLGGRGNLQDWEIMNRPAKGYNPGPRFEIAPFFVLYIQNDSISDTRLLEGPVPLYAYEGERGVDRVTNHGMPRFDSSGFEAAYPFGQVRLFHDRLPITVKIKGFNPLVPTDADKSGIPVAILRFELTNTSDQDMVASLCASMQNFIGDDGAFGVASGNQNAYREDPSFKGIFMHSLKVDETSEQWGTIAITTHSGGQVTHRTHWKPQHWGTSILDFWDDFSADGSLEDRPDNGENAPMASLAIKIELAPGEKKEVPFMISWHFPNVRAWSATTLKNYYTTRYSDAWDVAGRTYSELAALEKETLEFVNAFISADLPDVVKEAALFNISTLRTQTCFRTADGNFFTWEGCNNNSGCCFGSCTHVWNYEHAVGHLFGDLARRKREIEFGLATNEDGLMSFRVSLPKENIQSFGGAAADGQMGAIMKMYRDWQLSGDDDMLIRLYPNVKKAIQFCWIPGGWDADLDGVMEGVQHNTMDVEYYGPNPQMGIWYLGALRAVAEMADYMDDKDFAESCLALYSNGRKWIESNLFNGEYFIHQVQVPENIGDINPQLVIGMGGQDQLHPDYQLGEGCLVDQLVGQYVAHICGLGYLVDPDLVRTTLRSIMKYNYRESLNDHFNVFRTFALGRESALLMASYPYTRPVNPFPYFSEVMTGFEYTAAVGMLYEGAFEDGLKCIQNIRDRYDGFKRSPFDEAECGHHYGRAMASWSAILALTDFHYSGVTKKLTFSSKEGTYFWSTGYAYGTIKVVDEVNNKRVELTVLNGTLPLENIILKQYGESRIRTGTLDKGDAVTVRIRNNNAKAGDYKNLVPEKELDVIAPVVFLDEQGGSVRYASFTGPITVSLYCETPGTTIHYTLDRSEPDRQSAVYDGPLKIEESVVIKAMAFKRRKPGLVVSRAEFFKVTGFNDIRLVTAPSRKYRNQGAQTLVDGIRGSGSFNDGRWLGYEGDDFIAVFDLGEERALNKIDLGFKKDEGSWIFLPESVVLEYSEDGTLFSEIDRQDASQYHRIPGQNYYVVRFEPDTGIPIRYFKLTAKNIGTCPEGHPGAGGKAWIFIDEIGIE